MNNPVTVTIDLRDSFTVPSHCSLENSIIELDSDESFDMVLRVANQENSEKIPKSSKKKKSNDLLNSSNRKKICKSFGECAICGDELGNNPLASTKCGHVYCLECLEKSLQFKKRCPTCRTILKGKFAYHPLYLNK